MGVCSLGGGSDQGAWPGQVRARSIEGASVWEKMGAHSGLGRWSNLMNLLPPVLVHGADVRPVVKKELTAPWVAPHHGRVVQGGQATAVLVIGGAPEVQQCLGGGAKSKGVGREQGGGVHPGAR